MVSTPRLLLCARCVREVTSSPTPEHTRTGQARLQRQVGPYIDQRSLGFLKGVVKGGGNIRSSNEPGLKVVFEATIWRRNGPLVSDSTINDTAIASITSNLTHSANVGDVADKICCSRHIN